MTSPTQSPLFLPAAQNGFAGFYDLTFGVSSPAERKMVVERMAREGEAANSFGGVEARPVYEVWDGKILVAMLDVQMCSVDPTSTTARYRAKARVNGVYVLPEYRCYGIASALMTLLAARLLNKAELFRIALAAKAASDFQITLKFEGLPDVPFIWRLVDTLKRELGFVQAYCLDYLNVRFHCDVNEPDLKGVV